MQRVKLSMVAMMFYFGLSLQSASYGDALAVPSHFSSAPALTEGRRYEEVSPTNKNGNQAGAEIGSNGISGEARPALAAASGSAIFYFGRNQTTGALSGLEEWQVATRGAAGWMSRPALPKPTEITSFNDIPAITVPSEDLSHMLFLGTASFSSGDPVAGSNIYRSGEDPLLPPSWLGKPAIENPIPAPGSINTNFIEPAGGSRDFASVYFSFYGTLISADAPRAPYVPLTLFDPGFYEWTEGRGLSSAGVLPDGSVSPFGAVPAGELDRGHAVRADIFNNQVSQTGSRAFFVSPDPTGYGLETAACDKSTGGSAGCIPQLYVRETVPDGVRKTVLVSQESLTSSEDGLPAMAPHGVLAVIEPTGNTEAANDNPEDPSNTRLTDVYASADGSRAFFESVDRLTSDAPDDGMPKEYLFDTATNTLRYLAGVTDGAGGEAAPVVSAPDGTRLLFVRLDGSTGAVHELDLWTDGPGDGTVTRISGLPAVPNGPAQTHVNSGRTSANGSVFVFATSSPLSGGFNNDDIGRAANVEEIYRYDAIENMLTCVSCPPQGFTPKSSARISGTELVPSIYQLSRDHGISADGERVFFDTADPLVARDTNDVRDVYQWKAGTVSLISGGAGLSDSVILDSSEDGEDVFFATTDGLSGSDVDGEYDVYDARIPRHSEEAAGSPIPCRGDACEPPISSVSILGLLPASAVFSGSGDVAIKGPGDHNGVKTKGKTRKKTQARKRDRRRLKGSLKRRSIEAKSGRR